jgi:hypothetical protein
VLKPLSGVSEDQLLQMIHEVLSEGLIEELPDRMDRYQFNHALGQETLSTGLFNSRRVRPYSQIGEELENVHGASVAANAA